MVSVAEAMATFLERHGVDLVVGQSLPSAFHLAVTDTGMQQIQVRTENAGTAICDAYARVAGRLAVMTAQGGPAAVPFGRRRHSAASSVSSRPMAVCRAIRRSP